MSHSSLCWKWVAVQTCWSTAAWSTATNNGIKAEITRKCLQLLGLHGAGRLSATSNHHDLKSLINSSTRWHSDPKEKVFRIFSCSRVLHCGCRHCETLRPRAGSKSQVGLCRARASLPQPACPGHLRGWLPPDVGQDTRWSTRASSWERIAGYGNI